MQHSSLPKNRILILEEQRIIGFDLEQQLRKRGYCVSYERSLEDIQQTFLFGLSEIVICSLKSLQNNGLSDRAGSLSFVSGLIGPPALHYKTDTIVIDPDQGDIRHFEKPYKTEDIISFIGSLIGINKQKILINK